MMRVSTKSVCKAVGVDDFDFWRGRDRFNRTAFFFGARGPAGYVTERLPGDNERFSDFDFDELVAAGKAFCTRVTASHPSQEAVTE